MALLSKRSIINFPKCYKFIIVGILLLVLNQATTSSEVDIEVSDLPSELSKYKREVKNTGEFCEIPYNPLHTKYQILEESEVNYKPGDHVQTRSILETICDKGYNLSPVTHKHSICLNGKWDPTPTICSRSCSSLTSTSSTTVKCSYKGTHLDNCFNPVDETRVVLSCKLFYEEASVEKNPIRVCKNGKWIPPIPQCYPSCGMKTAKGKPNIINGINAAVGDYPWQIGIYNANKELICGGSIIDQHAILSAAHCFTDHYGNNSPTTDFFIAAGKYYRNYQDDRDQFAQYSNVLAIHTPENYKGGVHFYANDIAIVILTDPLTLSAVVQPVCVELNEAIHSLDFSANKNGTVTGWGYTEEGRKLSEVLKELQVPYIPYQRCYNEVPENFRRYITFDKICGGYTNSSTSICGGDSGGGLTLRNVVNNRYYLKGVVSTSPATEVLTCDSNTYSLYTAISHHKNFVRDLVQSYQPQQTVECTKEDCTDQETKSRNNCLFPNFPPNGKYILFSQNIIYTPGDYVPLESTLILSCDTGYDVSSLHASQSHCTNDGQWMPAPGTCISGSAINYLATDYFGISNKSSTLFPTNMTTPRTPSSILLPPFFVFPSNCGIFDDSSISRSLKDTVSGKNVRPNQFPWIAALMQHNNEEFKFICTGTLVSMKHIITTGHCVNNSRFSIENIFVIFGKDDLQGWFEDDFRNNSRLSKISIHPDYMYCSNCDIAVLTLSNNYKFSSNYINAICLWDESEELNLFVSEIGKVATWSYDEKYVTSRLPVSQNWDMAIVSEETCFSSNTSDSYINSNRSFCAGKRDGTGPCRGFTGGAFMMKRDGRWTLRGVLSRSISTPIGDCDRDSYYVFIDLPQFKSWLNLLLWPDNEVTTDRVTRKPRLRPTRRNRLRASKIS